MKVGYYLLLWVVGLGESQAQLPLPPPVLREPELSQPAGGAVPRELPQRWMTWNLQWFPGRNPLASKLERESHEAAVHFWLNRFKPDVGMFQEVLDAGALRRSIRELPWQAVTRFDRAEDEEKTLPPQNLALCSRVPWQEAWEVNFEKLPLTLDRPVRGFLGVEWKTQRQGSWTAYVVHLKSNRGGREVTSKRRERAIEYLRQDWQRRGLMPDTDAIAVGGDFNCSLKNPDFRKEKTVRGLLGEGWVSVTHDVPWPKGATVRPDKEGKYPATDFDAILLSPGWQKKIGSKRYQAGVWQNSNIPSDHWPIWLSFSRSRIASP